MSLPADLAKMISNNLFFNPMGPACTLTFVTTESNTAVVRSFDHVRLSIQTMGCWRDAEEDKQGYELQMG